jgi:proline iminopeptidase
VRKALTLVGVAAGAAVAGVATTLAVAWWTALPIVFVTAGWLAAAAVWLLAGRALPGCSRPLRVLGLVGLSAVLATGLIPLDDPAQPPATPPGAGRWTLPDGGWLTYGVVHAPPTAATRTPVVVLHGGPGVPDLAGFLTALTPLAADGHDIGAYAQRGSGGSSRLADPRGYTTDSAVDDLEQVRSRIGAQRLILVGHSYGAFLAAAYLAVHPDRVEKVIFSSPGDLSTAGLGGRPQTRLGVRQLLKLYALLAPPRALLTYALVQVNPAAAHALADDREMDARQDRVYAATLPAMHCRGRGGPPLHGLGFYANQVPQSLRSPATPDVRQALTGLRIPALIVKGQCDYLDWRSATQYLDTLPDSTLCYLPGAGHDSYLDRPDLFVAALRAFLAGTAVPGTLNDLHQPPRDYQR